MATTSPFFCHMVWVSMLGMEQATKTRAAGIKAYWRPETPGINRPETSNSLMPTPTAPPTKLSARPSEETLTTLASPAARSMEAL